MRSRGRLCHTEGYYCRKAGQPPGFAMSSFSKIYSSIYLAVLGLSCGLQDLRGGTRALVPRAEMEPARPALAVCIDPGGAPEKTLTLCDTDSAPSPRTRPCDRNAGTAWTPRALFAEPGHPDGLFLKIQVTVDSFWRQKKPAS